MKSAAAPTTAAAAKSSASAESAAVHGGEAVIALDAGLAAVMNPAEYAVVSARILALESLGAEALSAAAARRGCTTFGRPSTSSFGTAVPVI
jgi:hypothetical protein